MQFTIFILLEAHLFSNYIDELDDSLHHILTGRLAISTISLLFVDRFWSYLQFCDLEFHEEAIYDGWGVKKLSLCGPVDLVL